MERRLLGDSGFRITPVGLGTWAMGGDGSFGWGPQDDGESIAAIRKAVTTGINWIDTAPIYGFGHAETIVARALDGMAAADRPLVFTKVGLVWDDALRASHCLKPDSIRREVEASLQRLRAEALDLCQIHWPSFPPGAPAPDLEEAWAALAGLKQAGLVRHMGVSNFDAAQMERIRGIAPIASLQPPYSLLMRQIEDRILPYCRQHGIGVIVYAPLHNGLLSGRMSRERIAALAERDWRRRVNPAFREPHLSRSLELVETLRAIAARHRRSVAEVAIAWTLRHPAVTGAIVGARRPSQVDGFAGAWSLSLLDDDIRQIEAALPPSLVMMELVAGKSH